LVALRVYKPFFFLPHISFKLCVIYFYSHVADVKIANNVVDQASVTVGALKESLYKGVKISPIWGYNAYNMY